MSDTATAAPAGVSGPPVRIGRPRDLLLLLVFALAALILIEGVAVGLLVVSLRPSHPGLSPRSLIALAAQQAESSAFVAVPVQLALHLLLTAFIYVRVTRGAGSPFWKGMAWQPVGAGPAALLLVAGSALAILIQAGTLIFPPPEPLPFDRFFTSRAASLLIVGASLLTAPFFEELVFRGYLYGLLQPAWGAAPAVAVTGILFGLLHAPQLIPGWVQIGFLCLVGIVFSLARARTGSLQASFVMHLAYNATITALFLSSRQFSDLG